MNLEKVLKNQLLISMITIGMLLSSYIFTLAYNSSIKNGGEISTLAKIFMFLTIFFLFLFLIGFLLFVMSIFHVEGIREMLMNPDKISLVSIIMLLCTYLSTVMHSYVSPIFGDVSSVSLIFLNLALAFMVFFVITFVATIVSFSNKYIYSKKI